MENIPTPVWVAAGALPDAHGRWLMHRRPDHKHHGGLWEFPGGKLEAGEMPASALCRELHEELDIRIDPLVPVPAGFAQSEESEDKQSLVILLYTIARWAGVPRAVEGGAVEWFSPGQIAELAKPPLDSRLAAQLFAGSAR